MRGMRIEKMFHTRTRVFGKTRHDKIIAKISYREGSKMVDEMTGKTYNYEGKKKKDGIESVMLLPKKADPKWQNRHYLYNEVQRFETHKKAQFLREIEFALSDQFTKEENMEIAQKAAKKMVDKGMIADLFFHKLDQENPHCHMVLTMRKLKKDGQSFEDVKTRSWNQPSLVEGFRKELERLINEKYIEKGLDMYVDCRSYKERGINLIPQKHLPPQRDSQEYKEIAEQNKKIKRINEVTKQKEKSREKAVSTREKNKAEGLAKVEKTVITKEVVNEKVQEEKIILASLKTVRKEVKNMQMEQNKKQEERTEGHGYYSGSGTKQERRDPGKKTTVGKVYQEEKIEKIKQEQTKTKEHKQANEKRMTEFEKMKKKTKQAQRLIQYKKDDIQESRLKIMDLKAEMKGLSSFNLEDWKQKRALKREISKQKVAVKKKQFEIKKERRVIREARKDYLKHIKTEIGKFKEKVQAQIKTRKHIKEMDRLHEKTLKQELKDVISFEDFKKQKDKNIQMKTADEMKIEKEKQKEKTRER
ncbi:MobA/MobL family protein [Bacillus pacificus]